MYDISGSHFGPPRDSARLDDLVRRIGPPAGHGVPPDDHGALVEALTVVSSDLSLEDKLARLLEAGMDLTRARNGTLDFLDHHEHLCLRRSTPPEDDLLLPPTADGHLAADPPAVAPQAPREGRRPGRRVVEAAVRAGDQVVGHLHLSDKGTGHGFLDSDAAVVQALAGAAGLVIENARLREQTTHRDLWLSLPPELASGDPEDAAYQQVADWARDVSGADMGWVVAGSDPTTLRLRAVSGFEAPLDALAELDFSTSLAHSVATTGRALSVRSIAEHPHALDVPAEAGLGPSGPGLVVPVSGASGLEAVITLAWTGPEDSAVDEARRAGLPAVLSARAPLVLREARLGRSHQWQVVMQDRDRIAHDLHDLVIQRLFALGLDVQGVPWLRDPEAVFHRLNRASDEIDSTIRDIRRIIFRLGSMGDDTDPRAAIEGLVDRATRTMKLRPTLEFHGPVRTVIDNALLADVLAVLSEALSNAVRHARATRCTVELSVVDEVVVRVTDDGTGIPDSAEESGLTNVRRRAERRGGELVVTSSAGAGTTLVWRVPLD